MDTILALREKRKNLWDAAKAFLDTARDENGMVSAEDAARYDKMEADVVNLGKEIDRLERQQQLDAQLAVHLHNGFGGEFVGEIDSRFSHNRGPPFKIVA